MSNTILDAARIEGGTFKLYKERANIKDIILEVLDLTTYSACNKDDDKLKILYEPKDIFIDADKDRIVQVVSNILNNAVKFVKEKEGGGDRGEEERQITIITQIGVEKGEEDNKLIVSITDNGQGIDPEVIPRLFTKFATKSFDGTGLGLYICKNIKDWKGATFSFSLPLP